MDILRSKYEDLIAKEADIMKDLSRAEGQRKRPREQVLLWLEHVETIKNQVTGLERSREGNSTSCIANCYPRQGNSKLIIEMTEEVDRLQESSQFTEGLVILDDQFVEQFPDRPEFLAAPTLIGDSIHRTLNKILKDMINPNIGIVGIYGKGGVGKTTTMMNINNMLVATKVFDKIIWVNLSKHVSLDKVQNDIAMQMNMFLPMYEDQVSRAARLLERLKKTKKSLIILDDMWEPIPLHMVGIPLPNRYNGCKIVLTTRSWNVLWRMETNRNFKIEVLSRNEAWDLFVSKAGDNVLTPNIQPIAREMVRECDNLPILVISLAHAMRGEGKIEVWEKALEELSFSLTKIRDMEDKTLPLLKFDCNGLKDVKHLLDGPMFLNIPTLVGNSTQRTMSEILANLINPTVGIVGIYGKGGVGKTTTMMNIHNRVAKEKTFDKIIWVNLSKHWSLEKVQNDIAVQLNVELPKERFNVIRDVMLFSSLKDAKKFLIIFDDVWEPFSLKMVGIPLPNKRNGCKIVVTTRSSNVCWRMKTNKTIEIEVLSQNEAWDLFVSKCDRQVFFRAGIESIARQMVRECDHSPVLLASLGKALRFENDIKVWEKALEDLTSSLAQIQGMEEKNIRVLRLIYSSLKNESTRNCFLYSVFFPEDYLFESEELIRYWMAEEFIKEDGDMVMQIDLGFEILRELKDASMLEVFTRKGQEWLKMHDLFRDLATHILREEPEFLVKAGLGLKRTPYFWEWGYSRKISLIRNHIQILEDIEFCCPYLSTLLLQDNPLSHISSSFFFTMPAIQVLDMSYSSTTELPSSLSELTNLRVLFLQHCKSLKIIPSLENLKKLQVLNLRGTSIEELPLGTDGLVSLRSLDLSETTRLENINVGVISSLFSLEELQIQGSKFCKMDSPKVANCLKEMRCLKRLVILGLSTVGVEDHLDTIMYLQEKSLKRFTINVYGASGDFI
ncbi:hypothetical protein IFM89_035805 [Coptis chinensis]|uniref:AAA+ ATPase domain-containing protein n=1 Tax=Coptis chinensis TaxID=261450 RepID=A0A835I561_9MAGN|nr:hypothetical protein IFM89_035805 [Coptis chinensis]